MKKTLVIGDLNVDVIISGMTEFPELGREILCKDIRTLLGGSASIFACRLSQLGAKVDIIGKIGRDENGMIVLNTLKENGVGIGRVIVEDKLKTGVTVSLTYPENKALITFMGSIGALEPSDIKTEIFKEYDHLHVSSIYLQPKLLIALSKIFAEAKRIGLITSLDPQCDPEGKYNHIWDILEHVDIFLPNDSEITGITRLENPIEALRKIGLKVRTIVVKCGSRGAIGMLDGEVVSIKAFKIKPVDTTGAGDSFDAGFIYYFVHKSKGFEESIRFANAVGALSCLYIGGAEGKITEEETLRFIKESLAFTER
ncbi:MAG: carbohydrate kinase family protein [Candidatus Bathyarchaeia archaeon]|nr:carbohydrate kinase family protein [Candidatus Bathyarchaeota archaeon]